MILTGPVFVALSYKSIVMEPRQQLALMDKVIRELDDLKNSQTAVLKKIAQIEADNINLGVDLLSDALPGIHEEVDDAVEKVSTLLDDFRETRNKFENENQQYLVETP
jgi:hypothetical protein